MDQFMAQVMRQLEDIHRAHLVAERRNEERYQLLQDKLATVQKTLNQLLAARKLKSSSQTTSQQQQQQQHTPMTINIATDMRPSISSPTPLSSDTASLPLPLHQHQHQHQSQDATTPVTNGHNSHNHNNNGNSHLIKPVTRVGTPRPHDAPQFGMLPGLRTVEEVWREWTVGGGGDGESQHDGGGAVTPSVEERERRWPAGKWRRDAKVKSAFHQRKIIIEAIKARCERTRCSVAAAIAHFETLREAAKNTWLSPTGTSHEHPHHHHHFSDHENHHHHGHNHETSAGTQPHIVESIAIAQI
eukprot:jgi/Chlat1/949/Chrsp108S01380